MQWSASITPAISQHDSTKSANEVDVAGSKDAVGEAKKRIKGLLPSIQLDLAVDVSEESSDEEGPHKTPLSSVADLTFTQPGPESQRTTNHHIPSTQISRLTYLKPAQSTQTLLTPPMSHTCDIYPIETEEDSTI